MDALCSQIATILFDSRNGRGFKRTPFTTLKRAVFAPIPRLNTTRTVIVSAGLASRERTPYRRSFQKTSISNLSWYHSFCVQKTGLKHLGLVDRIDLNLPPFRYRR